MAQFINLARELCLCIVTVVRSLLISLMALAGSLLVILLAALALAGYLIYQATSWVADHPAIWLLPAATLPTLWLIREYVSGRDVTVERDWAIIVKKAGGEYKPLYRGWYKLKIGDRVCERLSLRPTSGETNLEEVYTRDEERVRLSAVYEMYISDPLRFHLLGRRRTVDFAELNQWALMDVVKDFGFDDLYNSPFEINELITRAINNQIRDHGLQVINYRLNEALWPESNERWSRNSPHLTLTTGQYWTDSRNLKRRLR